jgi:DNA mismatch repair protein MutL
VVPCTHALTHIVFEQHARLNSLGFEIQALESGHIAIHAFPSFLSPQKIPLIFEDILARVLAFHVFVNPQTTFLHSDTHPLLTKARNISQTLFTAELQLPPTGLQSAQVFHVLFATMACHSAVRAGEPLDEPLVKRLLFRAENIDFYAHCPHGRPVIRKFTTKDVASWFHRI